jgi:Transglutaminase-like superfamily
LSSSADAPPITGRPPLPLLVRLAAVATAVPLLMRADLPRLQRWLEPRRVRRAPSDGEAEALTLEYGRWVDRLIDRGGPIVRRGCLTRGVTLYYGLRREGLDVALCFGVGPHEGEMAAHCWLEWKDDPILETDNVMPTFTEVARMSALGVTG